jgi:hypothetical protein
MKDFPKQWERYRFLDSQGEATIVGIVIKVEVIEGCRSLMVLQENWDKNVDRVWKPDNPFNLQHYWDYECQELLGTTSLEELLLNEDELVRDFALKRKDELASLSSPDCIEESFYKQKQELKERIATASDEELDKLIDTL